MKEELNIVIVPNANEKTRSFKVSYNIIKYFMSAMVLLFIFLSFSLALYTYEYKALQAKAEQGERFAEINEQQKVEISQLNEIIDNLKKDTQMLEENLKHIADLKKRTTKEE